MNKNDLLTFALKLANESNRFAARAPVENAPDFTANMAASYLCGAIATAISEMVREMNSDAK